MKINEVIRKAEEIAKKYNPEGLSPFPFHRIQSDNSNLNIYLSNSLEPKISGIIYFDAKDKTFNIFVNKSKPETRIQFTIAHELGHYFLHQDYIVKKEAIVDDDNSLDGNNILFRTDIYERNKLETEANNFAAILIMPTKYIRKAWDKLQSVEECAKVFNVSVSAMSIRLEKLDLI
ncbi:ImmA/IrrE family metallo-endopeptidase [Candidatus Parcubacteria bacterium]|nr:ImmA/IrrE family metallo-endopeptidase [Candidatus Parcubacteria bacterium]